MTTIVRSALCRLAILGSAAVASPFAASATESDRSFPASGAITSASASAPGFDLTATAGIGERFGLKFDGRTATPPDAPGALTPPAPAIAAPAAATVATPPSVAPPVGEITGVTIDANGLPTVWTLGVATPGAAFEDEWTDPFRSYVARGEPTNTLRERRSKRLQPGESRWQWKAFTQLQYSVSDTFALRGGYKAMGTEGRMPFVAVVVRY
jgi:hypothetical protein